MNVFMGTYRCAIMCKFERGGANNPKEETTEKYMYANSDFQFQCPVVHNFIYHTTTHSSYEYYNLTA